MASLMSRVAGSYITTSPSTILPPEMVHHKLGSVGLPWMGFDIRIIDTDGRELPRGEIGEIERTGSSHHKIQAQQRHGAGVTDERYQDNRRDDDHRRSHEQPSEDGELSAQAHDGCGRAM